MSGISFFLSFYLFGFFGLRSIYKKKRKLGQSPSTRGRTILWKRFLCENAVWWWHCEIIVLSLRDAGAQQLQPSSFFLIWGLDVLCFVHAPHARALVFPSKRNSSFPSSSSLILSPPTDPQPSVTIRQRLTRVPVAGKRRRRRRRWENNDRTSESEGWRRGGESCLMTNQQLCLVISVEGDGGRILVKEEGVEWVLKEGWELMSRKQDISVVTPVYLLYIPSSHVNKN